MDKPDGIQDRLAAWRARGADRLDPLRFHLIQAMARRAAGLPGGARQVLDQRLAELLRQYEARVAQAAGPPDAAATGTAGSAPAAPTAPAPPGPGTLAPPEPGTLAGLLQYLDAAAGDGAVAAGAPTDQRARYPELGLLDDFRATWARLSTDRQLRQSQEQVHENAGPLNSSHLVHRALSLMREQSPGYLHQFLAYLDALAWMDQLGVGNAPPGKDAARAAKPRKSPRGR